MAIYNIFNAEKSSLDYAPVEEQQEVVVAQAPPAVEKRSGVFSAIAARLFFSLLLLGDFLWAGYSFLLFAFGAIGQLFTVSKVKYFREVRENAWISLRRSLVCGVCLFIALFSPAFGIMVACTYFLMYDKSGIEEVVPASLQSQFKEFLPKE